MMGFFKQPIKIPSSSKVKWHVADSYAIAKPLLYIFNQNTSNLEWIYTKT